MNLPEKYLESIQFTSVGEAIDVLGRMLGSSDLLGRIPELSSRLTEHVHISTVTATPFTKRVRDVCDSPEFRMLKNFEQLGLIKFVYPTATHSRFEHVLGTFGIACAYVRHLYLDDINPLFRQIASIELIETTLLAALLHDIGHYPLAHDFEDISNSAFSATQRTIAVLEAPSSGSSDFNGV